MLAEAYASNPEETKTTADRLMCHVVKRITGDLLTMSKRIESQHEEDAKKAYERLKEALETLETQGDLEKAIEFVQIHTEDIESLLPPPKSRWYRSMRFKVDVLHAIRVSLREV